MFFLFLAIFSSTGCRNRSPTLNAPMEKVQKLGKIKQLQRLVNFISELGIEHGYSHWIGNVEENIIEGFDFQKMFLVISKSY